MSEGHKWGRHLALVVAEHLVELLRPHCARIEIAGSLRRGKLRVGDIELVYVPIIEKRPDPSELFGREILVDSATTELNMLVRSGVLARRLSKAGHEAWGDKNKLAVHVASGISVDFFSTTEENWWVSLVVRTGSLESNLRLTRGALDRGRSLQAYGCGVEDLSTGQVGRATSERSVFEMCGVPYKPPEERD